MKIKQLIESETLKYQRKIEYLLEQSYKINLPDQHLESNYFKNKVINMIEYISSNKAKVYLCEDSEICGFIWFFEYHFINEKRLHINEIIVDEKYRGKGIGSKLLLKAFEFAESSEFPKKEELFSNIFKD